MVRLRFFDICIIFLSIAIISVFAFSVYSNAPEEPMVVIETRGEKFVYPLTEDRDIEVSGPLGETVVRIDGEGASVRVVSSPCPNKLCVRSGKLDSVGDWTACLPNFVLIRIDGKKDREDIDAIAF